jgi:hypothetical protein
MELRLDNASFRSQPMAPCAQCGTTLFAPEWSELVSDTRVRHLWVCSACGYSYETLVCFPERPQAKAA